LNSFLIWQYRGKPKAALTIDLLQTEASRSFKTALELSRVLDINVATGNNLDLVGKHVGISRTVSEFIDRRYFGFSRDINATAFNYGVFYRVNDTLRDPIQLTDEEYKFFIIAKAMRNYQLPTVDNITDSAKYLLGNAAVVIDNYDMTMNLIFPGKNVSQLILHAVLNMDILRRPVGVMYRFFMIMDDRPFGWAHDSNAFGFEIGKFSRILNVNNKKTEL
jgi:hypothetical protein